MQPHFYWFIRGGTTLYGQVQIPLATASIAFDCKSQYRVPEYRTQQPSIRMSILPSSLPSS